MLVVPAYAKVNLALEVTGLRPDGWHDIASVVSTVDWHDLVGVELRCPRRAQTGAPAVGLRLSGPFAEGVPGDGSNLAVRAAEALRSQAGQGCAFDLWLCKDVPAAAGLGGGSADAAAVLRAGAALLSAQGKPPQPHQLTAAAESLGSDVPALLAGGTLMVTGRGERLAPLPAPSLHLAIAVAAPSITAAAYAALRDDERRGDGRAARLADGLRHGTQTAQLDPATLGSALEAPAGRAAPGLAAALQRLRASTPGHAWHLTGSGGAAFALAPTRAQAHTLAAVARAAGFPARACRTVTAPLGPLPTAVTPRTDTAPLGPLPTAVTPRTDTASPGTPNAGTPPRPPA
jgi:4-diphosphocytidyl-2-C-methyl-D-erythritol kinase